MKNSFVNCDLHIHSCHSPCGSLEMGPKNVIGKLRENSISIAAITDHNSSLNTRGFYNLGLKNNILIFPGMEIQTVEEVHINVIFPDFITADKWDSWIKKSMQDIRCDPDIFGDQPIVNENEEILELYELLLLQSSNYDFETIINKAYNEKLIFFPCHIFEPSFSVTSQLGFLPSHIDPVSGKDKIPFLEIATRTNLDIIKSNKIYDRKTILTNSDAHYPNDIGKKYFQIQSKKLETLLDEFFHDHNSKKQTEIYKILYDSLISGENHFLVLKFLQ